MHLSKQKTLRYYIMSKFKKIDAGASLRLLMADRNMRPMHLAKGLDISSVTVTALRTNTSMSSKNINMLSEFFNMSPSEFIAVGERVGGE